MQAVCVLLTACPGAHVIQLVAAPAATESDAQATGAADVLEQECPGGHGMHTKLPVSSA